MPIRIVFMGSPEFAAPILRTLAQNYALVGVVTQPDRPAGRGKKVTPPPIKILAEQLSLPLIQPRRLRDPDALDQLRLWQPDLIVVAAFGQILRPEVLELPPVGCINVHASLLPRWRGAAPIQAAILNNDLQTGVTVMRMDPGVDTGPILSQRAEPILPEDTSGSLSARLAEKGAALLIETLPGYLDGSISPTAQDESLATYAPMLKKEDGRLDFNQPAGLLARQVRAYQPWPGAFTLWQEQPLKVQRASIAPFNLTSGEQLRPGRLVRFNGLPAVCTAQDLLVLEELQPAGKRSMTGKDFLQGAKNWGIL
jgi:methionyl-tRNA formyltransferase